MQSIQEIISGLQAGENRALARAITWVENDMPGCREILLLSSTRKAPIVIGITGPPGAGKSTLINALAGQLATHSKVAILAIDPTSPFTQGSLLGDRLRMAEHFNNEKIFIRSIATRGSLGGLSAKTMEITDVLRLAGFDFVIIETVGVGQSEVEIAALADTTVVVFVPESGDEIQTIKSGIMEIGDIFVVNKADREGADVFTRHIRQVLHNHTHNAWEIPVIKTIATRGEGVHELIDKVMLHQKVDKTNASDSLLLHKAIHLIIAEKMKTIDKKKLEIKLKKESREPGFNLYRFISTYYQ